MTVRQLKAFPNKPPAPAPEPWPRCEDTVNTYSDHDLAWRKNRYGDQEPLRCTRQAVVEIGGFKLCRLHGGHKALDMYLAEDTLAQRLDRLLAYPVDESIQARGYDFKHDADTVGYAVELIKEALK